MPRQSRIDVPGAVHHIIARGIERSKIFRDDQDRDRFLMRFGELINETQTRCYAWALIPNHFHLLLKTGNVPIATLMRRLLTGYAIGFNRRYRRSGHVFQNRYKSILCQEDAFLKELVRYIHLNPLRAGLVNDMVALDKYCYSGHSHLMGKNKNGWQSADEVLAYFGSKRGLAKQRYREFVIKGIKLGRQSELIGGGLVRSAGGWSAVRSLQKAGVFQKSDERILGDGDFINSVLSEAQEAINNRYFLAAKGICLSDILSAVSDMYGLEVNELVGPSKQRPVVKARALICFWAVDALGMSMVDVARQLKIALSTVSAAVKKGRKLVKEDGLVVTEILNIEI